MRELAARSAEARERALSRCKLLEPQLEGGGLRTVAMDPKCASARRSG
jgi:hypothetical protein